MSTPVSQRLRDVRTDSEEQSERILLALRAIVIEYPDLSMYVDHLHEDCGDAADLIDDQAATIAAHRRLCAAYSAKITFLTARLKAADDNNAGLSTTNDALTAKVVELGKALGGTASVARGNRERSVDAGNRLTRDVNPQKNSRIRSDASSHETESQAVSDEDDRRSEPSFESSIIKDGYREPLSTSSSAIEAKCPPPASAYSVDEVIVSVQPMRCAFTIRNKTSGTAIIGNPFEEMLGWAVTLEIDISRHGSPSLSLKFRIRRGKKNQPVGEKHDQYTAFNVTWRPGVLVYNKPMIADLSAWIVNRKERGAFVRGGIVPHHPDVVDLCPINEHNKLQRLLALSFESHAVDKPDRSPIHKKDWKGLPKDVQDGFDCLFFQTCQRRVTLWVCVERNIEAAGKTWLGKLGHAVMND